MLTRYVQHRAAVAEVAVPDPAGAGAEAGRHGEGKDGARRVRRAGLRHDLRAHQGVH